MADIFIILALIVLNGLFSMAEIALISARKVRLESQAAKGDLKAARALQLSGHPDSFLSTVQIGITLIGVLTGIYSGDNFKAPLQQWLSGFPLLQPYSAALSTVLIVIILTYLSMVLGELVPKRIGLSNPEKAAKILAGPMLLLLKITYPFIWLLSKSAHLILKLLGIRSNDNQVTEEEIKAIIRTNTQ